MIAGRRRGGCSYYGYKLYTISDVDLGLIRDLEATSALVHDSRVGLSRPVEVVYWDRGYFGVKLSGWDATMRCRTRGHPLGIQDRLRNRRINRKKAPGSVCLHWSRARAGHVLVTTVQRVRVKMVFSCFCFNLVQLGTLEARS